LKLNVTVVEKMLGGSGDAADLDHFGATTADAATFLGDLVWTFVH
jgi:hypothetical protein